MVTIQADNEDINIVFNNLLSNAVKYNHEGGKVDIIIDRDNGDAVIKVIDTGIGISGKDQEVLFDDFVRIKNEKTRNISGSGLGLSIVKKIVELYHGLIIVESTVGEGSTFIVTIPVKLVPD